MRDMADELLRLYAERKLVQGHAFPPDERAAFYHVIETRRDIRAFRSDPIPEDILMKILGAAHHAPSVGLMQPWNFIVIHDRATKARVHALFLQENQAAAANYEGPRAALYGTLKLEGIEDAPVNVCVTCDRTRGGPHVLGRNTIVDTDLFSTCCAIENLWLAARGRVDTVPPGGPQQIRPRLARRPRRPPALTRSSCTTSARGGPVR